MHQLRKAFRKRSCSVWKSKFAREAPCRCSASAGREIPPRADAKTVTALIICHTKDLVSIFVEAKLYSKAKPSEYTAIFTRGPLTRVPTASSKQGKCLGGVAGSLQPSGETSEGFGGFLADNAFLYQFFMKMRRITTPGGCITTAPSQQSRLGVSPESAASKGSIPEVLRGA